MGLRGFRVGVVCGIVALVLLRAFVNVTAVSDWVVAPLLVPDEIGKADAIVVSGAGVVGDCAPNLTGLRRVLLAARLWREGRAPVVVITGGTGPIECPVATAMARLGTEVGLPADRIRVETSSRSTHENAELSAPLLKGWSMRSLLLVTDRLHMRRASAAYRRQGFDVGRASVPIYEGHPDNVSMLMAGLREYVALAYYSLRGWLASNAVAAAPPSASEVEGDPWVEPQTGGRNTMDAGTGPLVLLGASYAESWSLKDVSGVVVVNRGMPGQQSFELLERFERDVVPLRPRAVLIWGFINDISRAPADGMDAALSRVRQSYGAMVQAARRHGIRPLLASEVTMRPPGGLVNTMMGWLGELRGKEAYQDFVNKHVLATNAWLADLSAREGVPLLDFQRVLSEANGRRRPAYAQADGSHITPAGYAALTSYAVPVLEKLLDAR